MVVQMLFLLLYEIRNFFNREQELMPDRKIGDRRFISLIYYNFFVGLVT